METAGLREIEAVERLAAKGYEVAHAFLNRWDDPATRASRDDCAQEAVFSAIGCYPAMREPSRFPALVRTIARRARYRELRWHMRLRAAGFLMLSMDRDGDAFAELAAQVREGRSDNLLVADQCVDKHWLLCALDAALDRLPGLYRAILRGYYEGFSCVELAERYGIAEENVKVRLHRGRHKVRAELEREVRQTKEA